MGRKVRHVTEYSLRIRGVLAGAVYAEQDLRDLWHHLDHAIRLASPRERANIERVFAAEMGPAAAGERKHARCDGHAGDVQREAAFLPSGIAITAPASHPRRGVGGPLPLRASSFARCSASACLAPE